jgi:threonine synthase
MDPHTAVAWRAADRVADRAAGPLVVLSTAHPAKFPDVVERATGAAPALPAALAARLDGPETTIRLPADGTALRALLLDETSP